MMRLIAARLAQGAALLLALSFAMFALLAHLPGDPVDLLIASNPEITADDVARLKKLRGLDQPFHIQWYRWLVGVQHDDGFACGAICALTGDTQALGWSHATKRPVAELLFGPPCPECSFAESLTTMGRVGNTLVLSVPSLFLAMLLSLIAGTWAGMRRGRVDRVITTTSAIVSATPAFFVALLFVTLFAEQLRWLPSSGVFMPGVHEEGAFATVVDRARHAVLPVSVLVLAWSGSFVRQVRSSVIAATDGDYVRTARMTGASEARVIMKHILPNAAVPLVTLAGLSLPALFGGALLTETVFAWPGVGRLQYDSVLQNDSYTAIVVFLLSAAMVLFGSLCADVAVRLIDPRTAGKRV